jgi:hypothetical protein
MEEDSLIELRVAGGIGNNELPLNEVGTREMHERHRIELEAGEIFARGRVTDQTFVDRLLLKKLIEIHHHSAAERLVQEAIKAGMFVRSPNWTGIPGNNRKDAYTNGLLRYSRTLRFVRTRLGHEAVPILVKVVVEDRAAENEDEFHVVVAALDLLSNR